MMGRAMEAGCSDRHSADLAQTLLDTLRNSPAERARRDPSGVIRAACRKRY